LSDLIFRRTMAMNPTWRSLWIVT